MKTTTKRRSLLILLSIMIFCLCVCLIVSSGIQGVDAEMTNISRTMYYVEAGNLVDNEQGVGTQTDRGTLGYTNRQDTTYMINNGLSFTGENALYNSGTDQVWGQDPTSGKYWGFTTYSWDNQYRFINTTYDDPNPNDADGDTSTRPNADGLFASERYLNESSLEGRLEYAFQVDGDGEVIVEVGMWNSRKYGKGTHTNQLYLNGVKAGDVVSQSTQTYYKFTTNGVKEENGDNYYISLSFRDDNGELLVSQGQTVDATNVNQIHLSWIKISVPFVTPTYIVKGQDINVIYEGQQTEFIPDTAGQATIDNAEPLTWTGITGTVNQIPTTIWTNILPANTVYFLDSGYTKDFHSIEPTVVKKDIEREENGTYGYTSAGSSVAWENGESYNMSMRIGATDGLKYSFDLDAGEYNVIVGTYLPDETWVARTLDVSFTNNDGWTAVTSGIIEATAFNTQIIGEFSGYNCDKKLEMTVTCQTQNPIVTFVCIYKDYTLERYAKQGDGIYAVDPTTGERVACTITAGLEDFNNANALDAVTISATTVDGKKTFENRTVYVLPQTTTYFVDAGLDIEREHNVNTDIAYTEGKGYGYQGDNTVVQYNNFLHHGDSIRVGTYLTDETENRTLSYKFDVQNGDYAVIVGSHDWWNANGRDIAIRINSDIPQILHAPYNTQVTKKLFTSVTDTNGINIVATGDNNGPQNNDAIISFVLIYKIQTVKYQEENGTEIVTNYIDTDVTSTFNLLPRRDKADYAFVGWQKDNTLYKAGKEMSLTDAGVYTAKYVKFKLKVGASVRLGTPNGLRFGVMLDKEGLDALASLGADYSFGADIRSKKTIDSAMSTQSIRSEGVKEKLYKDNGDYMYYIALTDIKEANYNRLFYAFPDLTITYADNTTETTYVEPSDNDGRSFAYVVKEAYNDVKTSPEGIYVHSVVNNNEETVYSRYKGTQYAVLKTLYSTVFPNNESLTAYQDLSVFKTVSASATTLGTANNNFVTVGQNGSYTFRTYFKIREYGKFNYSFYYDNTLDSSYWFQEGANANATGSAFTVDNAYFATADSVGGSIDQKTYAITFNGEQSVAVGAGAEIIGDKTEVEVQSGKLLVFTWTISVKAGDKLPYTISDFASCYKSVDGINFVNAYDVFEQNVMIAPNKIMYDHIRTDNTKNLVFVGDSITQGVGTTRDGYNFWVSKVADGLSTDSSVWNLGSGNANATNLNSENGVWLEKAKTADELFICLGVNDIGDKALTVEQFKQLINGIVSKVKADNPNCIITLFTVPPFYTGVQAQTWSDMNTWIRQQNVVGVDRYFDIAKILCDSVFTNKLKEEYKSLTLLDNHPNDTAGSAVAEAFLAWYQEQ